MIIIGYTCILQLHKEDLVEESYGTGSSDQRPVADAAVNNGNTNFHPVPCHIAAQVRIHACSPIHLSTCIRNNASCFYQSPFCYHKEDFNMPMKIKNLFVTHMHTCI